MKYIDSHIHLDRYLDEEIEEIVTRPDLQAVLAVSTDLESSKRNLELKKRYSNKVKIACGFHPEQDIQPLEPLIEWIEKHHQDLDAIGEVGLPFYLHQSHLANFQTEKYIDLLRQFVHLASKFQKPIVLHAIYEDTRLALDLLEEYSIPKAHFHWLKTDFTSLERIAENGYYVSVTPDILYKEKTAKIAKGFPLHQLMMETDGPWRYEGPFANTPTTPFFLPDVIRKIAQLRRIDARELAKILLGNTQRFYSSFHLHP